MPASADPDPISGLEVRDLIIVFPGRGPLLSIPHLSIAQGEKLAIEGPSGAGKSSLLHTLAGIERPAQGSVVWGHDALWTMPEAARDRWRRERLGLVFQDMHLLHGLTALENVLLPIRFDHARVPPQRREHATTMLRDLGIAPDRRTAVLSRGERQRVALARALLRRPAVLLADEPTASLDQVSALQVGALLLKAATDVGATLIVTTHDPALLSLLPRRLRLRGGSLEPAP